MQLVFPSNIAQYEAVSLSENTFDGIPEFATLVGERKHQRVTVTASTLSALKSANEVTLRILGENCAPDGWGNTTVSLFGSGGRSFYRRKMALQGSDKDAVVQEKARRWLQFGGMNCGDIAAIAFSELAAEGHDRPLFVVKERDDDHGYVLSGDPRDPTWGEKNTVVVDAYPHAPTAHTLAESESDPAYDRPVESYAPGTAARSFSIRTELAKDRVPVAQLDQFAADRGYPEVGRESLLWLANGGAGVELWNMPKSAKDVSTIYADGEREGVFNYVPEASFMRALSNIAHMNADQFPDNYKPPIDPRMLARLSYSLDDDSFAKLLKQFGIRDSLESIRSAGSADTAG